MTKKVIFILLLLTGILAVGGVWWLWRLGGETLAQEAEQTKLTAKTSNMPADDFDELETRLAALVERAAAQTQTLPLMLADEIKPPPTISYQTEELKIVPDSAAAKTAYQRELENILVAHYQAIPENELRVLLATMDETDPAGAAKLEAATRQHRQTVIRLKSIAVPEAAAEGHRQLLNRAAALAETVHYMSDFNRQPVLALQYAQKYSERSLTLLRTLMDMNQLFLN